MKSEREESSKFDSGIVNYLRLTNEMFSKMSTPSTQEKIRNTSRDFIIEGSFKESVKKTTNPYFIQNKEIHSMINSKFVKPEIKKKFHGMLYDFLQKPNIKVNKFQERDRQLIKETLNRMKTSRKYSQPVSPAREVNDDPERSVSPGLLYKRSLVYNIITKKEEDKNKKLTNSSFNNKNDSFFFYTKGLSKNSSMPNYNKAKSNYMSLYKKNNFFSSSSYLGKEKKKSNFKSISTGSTQNSFLSLYGDKSSLKKSYRESYSNNNSNNFSVSISVKKKPDKVSSPFFKDFSSL